MTITYLFKNRERPPVLSKRWLVVWVKRGLSFRSLLGILIRRYKLNLKGCQVGKLSVVYDFHINGRFENVCIGEHTFVAKGVHIASHAKVLIGSRVVINDGVKLLTASHSLSDPEWKMWDAPINIGDYAWVATDAIVLPGVSVGKGAVVAAGAVVRCDVPDYALAIGNPAEIFSSKRVVDLDYDPVAFCAPYEAWLGGARLKKL